MDEAEELKGFFPNLISEGIDKLLELGKEGKNVKFKMNGKWYYSVQTEDEMYHTFANKSKAEYIVSQQEQERRYQDYMKEQEKKASQMRDAIVFEDLPKWTEGFKQLFDKKTYKDCMKYINELLQDAPSVMFVEYKKKNFDLAYDILKALKADDKETAKQKYMEIGKGYDDRIRSSAYEIIRHSHYIEPILDVIEKDIFDIYDDKYKAKEYIQELKELIEEKKTQSAMEGEQPGGPN